MDGWWINNGFIQFQVQMKLKGCQMCLRNRCQQTLYQTEVYISTLNKKKNPKKKNKEVTY